MAYGNHTIREQLYYSVYGLSHLNGTEPEQRQCEPAQQMV